jgi:hypothetical protein
MSFSAGSSRRAAILALALLPVLAGLERPAVARVFLTVEEALQLAFPGCEVQRRTAYLTAEQMKRARELSGVDVPSALVTYYTAVKAGVPQGTAYFDTHRVRTLPETLMVVIDPQGKVRRIEVLSFREPEEYMPKEIWYDQFENQELDRDLEIKRDIRPVTGATLTARATTTAARRVLAIHQVISAGGAGAKP